MGMEIDSLEVAIRAQAQDASRQIDTLYNKIGSLSKALNGTAGSYRKAATEIGRVTAAIRGLAAAKIPNLNGLIQQLETLSKIDLSSLANKKINVDLEINAPKSASQIQWALQEAADAAKIDSDKIADQLINEYSLRGKAASSMRSAVSAMASELAQGFNGTNFENSFDIIKKYFAEIEKIIWEEGKLISANIGDFSTLMNASGFVVGTNGDAIKTALADIPSSAKSVLSNVQETINTSLYGDEIRSGVYESLVNNISGAYEKAMKVASNQMTLDVEVNQAKIVRDIQNAINKATKVDYTPVQVNLQVNKQGIRDRITEELQKVSPGNLTAVSDAYQNMLNSIMQAHLSLGQSNGINNVVNALTRLGNVDLRKFDTAKLNEIITAITSLSSMSDSASSVAKLVSALARLANVGEVVSTTAQALPALGSAIKGAFEEIASVNISEVIERVLNAFTRLATSGQKAQVAAQNLPNVTAAVRGFFDAMAEVPAINDTTLRMVESFTALATTGRRIGSVGNQVTKAFKDVDTAGTKTVKTFSDVSGKSNLVVNAFKKMLSACKNAVSGLGSGAKKLLSHFKQIGQGSNHIQKATLSLKNLLQVAVGFYGIRSLFNWGKEAIEFASDLTEVQNVVENSFGTQGTKNVEEFAETANKSFGMTELTAKKVAARYQAMGNAMGITAGQVAQATQNIAKNLNADLYDDTGEAMGAMSINLTKLAADMASFYNVEQDTAAEALNAVYTGQTRPLRQYGLDLTQATLEEWAHKQGIEGKISAMTQAEKTMLRYQYVMAQTSTIQGDFARTSDTWANQVRMLKQNLQALGGVVGTTLINAFKPLIAWLNTAISTVTSFAETVGNALGKIFGWQILHTPASNAADAYATLSEGMDDAGASGEDAAGGINDATKAAEEYKNTVLGFDELNKLNDVKDPTSTSNKGNGSGKGDGGSALPSTDGTGADFQIIKQKPWLEDYKSNIDSLEELGTYISNALTKAMGKIKWNEIYQKARDFGTGLANFLNGLIKPELFSALGGTIAGAVNTVLNAADAFLDKFNFKNLGDSLAAGINKFFADWDAGLTGSVFGKAINGISEAIVAAATSIKWGDLGSKIATSINTFFKTWKPELTANAFSKTVNGIVDAIKAACDEITWNSIGTKISTMVRDALGGIQWKEKVYPAADSFGTGIANFLNGLIKPSTFWKIGESVASVLNTALHILDTFGSTFDFKTFGLSIASAIKGFFKTWSPELTADTFNKLALGILTAAREAVGNVNWVAVGSKIRVMLVNIKWGEILKSVGTAIMGGVNAALDFAKGIFDGTPVSDAIETLKNKINEMAKLIKFDDLKDGLQGILDVGLKFGAGFMKGFTDALGAIAKIGGAALYLIGGALQTIGDALTSIDPDWIEQVGYALGVVATSILSIKGAQAVAGIISSVTGTFLGLGTATGEVAEATAAATTSMTTAGTTATATGGFVGALSGKIGGVVSNLVSWGKEALAVGAPIAGLITSSVSLGAAAQGAGERIRGGNGVLSTFGTLMQTMANEFSPELRDELFLLTEGFEDNGIKGDEAAEKLAAFFHNNNIDPTYIESALRRAQGELGVTGTDVDTVEYALSLLQTRFKTTGSQVALTDEDFSSFDTILTEMVQQGIIPSTTHLDLLKDTLTECQGEGKTSKETFETLKKKMDEMYISTDTFTSSAKEKVPSAFGAMQTSAEKADEKTSTFWSSLFGSIGQVATNALKMLVMGAGFDTLGDKSGDAEEDVSGLDTAVNNFVTKIPTYASDTKKNSADLIGNCFAGGEQAIKDKSGAFQKSFENALIWNPQKAVKEGNGINSPSTVYYGFGANIVAGMKNAINDKGSTVVSALKNVMNNMKSAVTGQCDDFETKGESLADSFKDGLESVSFSSVASSWEDTLDMSGLASTLYDAGYDAAESLANGLSAVSMPTLSYYISDWDEHDLGDGNYSSTPIYSPNWYAMGGFPNVGELFIGNENGIEMMGRMGHRNVVANNQQITEGIKAAVVDGMMEVYMATNSGSDELPYQLNIKMVTPDGEVLAQQVEKGKARRDARFNTVGYSYG